MEYVRKNKIIEIQRDNRNKLQSGIDITLDNNSTQHFSIDTNGLFDLITILADPNLENEKYSIIQKITEFKQ